MTSLCVTGMRAGYQDRSVVNDVSFTVEPGSIFGLIGPNGSGKTTLLKCILGLMRPWGGSVRIGSADASRISPKELAKKVAFIPQTHSMTFPYTVDEYVSMGRYPHRGRMMPLTADDRRIVAEALDLLDLSGVKDKRIQQLSGGEMQRVFLASGLAQKPEILLVDEPTTHLDIGHQARLLDIMKELSESSRLTVLVTLHELNLASLYCTSLALLDHGRIHAQGSPEEVLTAENIRHVYKAHVEVGSDPVSAKPHVYFIPGRTGERG